MNKFKMAGVTIMMTMIAGFCEAATFLACNHTFSVHVLANLVLSIAQVVYGYTILDGLRLITLPVFAIAVFAGYYLISRNIARQNILLIEGILLIAGGALSMLYDGHFMVTVITNLVVAAMGLQTCYMWSYPDHSYARGAGILGHIALLVISFNNSAPGERMGILKALLFQFSLAAGGFVLGCITGGCFTIYFGFVALLIPGVVMINAYLMFNAEL